MGARPTLNNVTFSTWAQPFVGEKTKTVTVQGPYNGQQTAASVATTDVLTVSADYGIYDTTASVNIDSNSTNFKDDI